MQLVIFVLGALFSLALQFLAARLGLLREQARESWIRRLNSYQDFSTAAVGLAELWLAGADVPESQVWEAITHARKAAYDAALYDETRTQLTSRMRDLSGDLVRLASETSPRPGGTPAGHRRDERDLGRVRRVRGYAPRAVSIALASPLEPRLVRRDDLAPRRAGSSYG